MKRNRLVSHIKGSYLKEQYLEAFLVQSAYIEALLKLFCDFSFWLQVKDKLKEDNKLIWTLRKKVNHLNLYELIEFLFKGGLIDLAQKSDLHKYREKRNDILHDLVTQMSTELFEKELKEICDLGDKIIEDEKFKRMEGVIDRREMREAMKKEDVVMSRPVSIPPASDTPLKV